MDLVFQGQIITFFGYVIKDRFPQRQLKLIVLEIFSYLMAETKD
jgi:hypothetical protein